MNEDLVVLGAGGHAKVVIDAALCSGWRPGVLLDDDPGKQGTAYIGVPVTGRCSQWSTLQGRLSFVVAVGNNEVRARLQTELEAADRNVAVIRHPFCAIANSASIAAGTVVLAGAVVNADARLGRGVIVNTGATIDHDCIVGDWVHVAPGVTMCGAVQVGDGTLLGVGSRVLPGVRIGRGCVIGGGAVVHRDLPDNARAVGVPARPLGVR